MKTVKKERNKGITLIALIITVIVLLILAGVSISVVVGDNGVLTQSQQASTKTNKATEFETIQFSVVGSVNDEGILDLAMLVSNLRKDMPSGTVIETEKDNEENDIFPVKVTAKYGRYTIDGNGKAEEVSGVEISPKLLKLLEETTGNLTANLFGDSIGETVTWTATDGAMFNDDETIATGLNVTVKAIAGKIIAQVGEKTSECTVTVVGNVQSAEGLTSLSGMATKKLNVLNKITNKDLIEDITFSLDNTNTTTTGASVDDKTGIVTLGNFTTGDNAKVTVILTGVLSNLTKSVEITVIPSDGPKVGDFVTYDAGEWQTDSDGKIIIHYTDGSTEKIENSPSLPSPFKFGGFTTTSGKNGNATPYSSTYNYVQEKIIEDGVITTKDITGWRIFDISDNGAITLISAGCPESYGNGPNYFNGCYSEYILAGGEKIQSNVTIPDNYKTRDWTADYGNSSQDITAYVLTNYKLVDWYKKYVDAFALSLRFGNYEYASVRGETVFQKIYRTSTNCVNNGRYESLIDNYSFYWLATYSTKDRYNMMYRCYTREKLC